MHFKHSWKISSFRRSVHSIKKYILITTMCKVSCKALEQIMETEKDKGRLTAKVSLKRKHAMFRTLNW